MNNFRQELVDFETFPVEEDRFPIRDVLTAGAVFAAGVGFIAVARSEKVLNSVDRYFGDKVQSISDKYKALREALSLDGARLLLAHEVSKPTREERRMNRKIKSVVPRLASPEVPLGDEE